MKFGIQTARDRSSVRRSIETRCEALVARESRSIGRTLRDLSEDGAFLETTVELGLGEHVYLSFRAPRTRLRIGVRAQVVRCVQGRRTTDRARGVGLRSEPLEAVDRAILKRSLARTPPPVPARKARPDYAATVLSIAVG